MFTRSVVLSSLVFLVGSCQNPANVADIPDAQTTSNPAEAPCHEVLTPPEVTPAEPQPVARKRPATSAPQTVPVAPTPRQPKRPENNWVIWREVFKHKDDASFEATWLGDNKFKVKTRNLKRVTMDMTLLPEGAPKNGPWILYMDGQGIEMTGFKPKRGFTGHKRDLVRSKNGHWTVDKKKLYRAGSLKK